MDKKMIDGLKAALASYLRSFIAAGLAVYTAGLTDWKAVICAGLSAVVPVAIRALNPKDSAFGIVAAIVETKLTSVSKKTK